MKNWFKKDKYIDYKERLKLAFPKSLESDLNVVLDIIPFGENRIKLCDGNTHIIGNLIHEDYYSTIFDSKELKIPFRLYFNEPSSESEKTLNEKQQAILNCIYLRHHNGFLRQKRLEKLKGIDFYWITPFTFQLLGEYVFEILEVLDNQLDDKQLENYKKYALENPKYWRQTEGRMISYWNEYYRFKSPKIKTYIGRLIFDQIKIKTQGFKVDEIIEIGIDSKERLFLKPKREKFPLIYRPATEVHWDEKENYLYSPKPREWNYLDWYKQITSVIETECNYRLLLTYRTTWINMSDELKKTDKNKKSDRITRRILHSLPQAQPRLRSIRPYVSGHCIRQTATRSMNFKKIIMKDREEIIKNYVDGYNSFDVSKMIMDLSDEIVFENVQNAEITMTLNGLDEFKTQAEIAKSYFSERQQKIKTFRHESEKSEIEIEYYGVLAMDFPNGMKKGDEIKLNGKSIFEFKNNKIIRLTDIS